MPGRKIVVAHRPFSDKHTQRPAQPQGIEELIEIAGKSAKISADSIAVFSVTSRNDYYFAEYQLAPARYYGANSDISRFEFCNTEATFATSLPRLVNLTLRHCRPVLRHKTVVDIIRIIIIGRRPACSRGGFGHRQHNKAEHRKAKRYIGACVSVQKNQSVSIRCGAYVLPASRKAAAHRWL